MSIETNQFHRLDAKNAKKNTLGFLGVLCVSAVDRGFLSAVPNVHHVSILHDVVFAFEAQGAFGSGIRFRSRF